MGRFRFEIRKFFDQDCTPQLYHPLVSRCGHFMDRACVKLARSLNRRYPVLHFRVPGEYPYP